MIVPFWVNPLAPLAAVAFGVEDGWKATRDEPGAMWPGRPLLTKLYYRGLVLGVGARQVRDGVSLVRVAFGLRTPGKGGHRG